LPESFLVTQGSAVAAALDMAADSLLLSVAGHITFGYELAVQSPWLQHVQVIDEDLMNR
jgi:hypothetical protein